jgi:DUF4097 and DUF4098 domain-containing protein YvlB
MRRTLFFLAVGVVLGALPAGAQDPHIRVVIKDAIRDAAKTATPRAYQGRNRNNGPEETEKFSRKVKVGRDGRVSISNISGEIKLSGGSGDEVVIDAVKRTRGDASQLAATHIIVDERPGRVEVRTEYDSDRGRRYNNTNVSVDYTVLVPAGATVDVKSISGSVTVTGVQGVVHAETISGTLAASSTPKLTAKTVSGDLELISAPADADLAATTISGNIRAKGLRIRTLDLGSVSGDVALTDIACDRLGVKSVSGSVEFAGTLGKGGRYEINSHSGSVRLALSGNTGFELNANSFSGSIRSDFPVTLGGTTARSDRGRPGPGRATHAVFGDGSATLNLRTFSGDIVLTKR